MLLDLHAHPAPSTQEDYEHMQCQKASPLPFADAAFPSSTLIPRHELTYFLADWFVIFRTLYK